jgi:hypothetical protein
VVATIGGQTEYVLPVDAFEQRLEKLEANIGGSYYEIKRVDYRDASPLESIQTSSIPDYYSVVGGKFRLYPTPNGAYSLRAWYLKDPEPLVLEQGRLTVVNTASNYVIVDSIGSALTTEMDQLDSYVNIVNGNTGEIRCSLQIQSIAGNKITFKATPARTSILGRRTIVGAIPTTVQLDDYICVASGTCIPVFKKPFTNYLIQFAVCDITRKMGGDAGLDIQLREELGETVRRSWVGREQTLRVKQTSRVWNRSGRRWFGG